MALDEKDVQLITTAFEETWHDNAGKLKDDIINAVRVEINYAVDKLTNIDAPTLLAERVRKHQVWIQQLAKKIGIRLDS